MTPTPTPTPNRYFDGKQPILSLSVGLCTDDTKTNEILISSVKTTLIRKFHFTEFLPKHPTQIFVSARNPEVELFSRFERFREQLFRFRRPTKRTIFCHQKVRLGRRFESNFQLSIANNNKRTFFLQIFFF